MGKRQASEAAGNVVRRRSLAATDVVSLLFAAAAALSHPLPQIAWGAVGHTHARWSLKNEAIQRLSPREGRRERRREKHDMFKLISFFLPPQLNLNISHRHNIPCNGFRRVALAATTTAQFGGGRELRQRNRVALRRTHLRICESAAGAGAGRRRRTEEHM